MSSSERAAAPEDRAASAAAAGEAKAAAAFGRLYSIIARLRAPDGCPWDKEQTPKSLRGSVIEEAYELVEAINESDPAHVAEEAGDLFMLAAMIPYMYEQEGAFTVADALDGVSDKLVRRHPHVFGEASAETPDAVVRQWNEIKEKVEGRRRKDSLLDEVSHALPPLERAYKLQKKAAKVGFDWPDPAGVWAKAREELAESEEACMRSAESGDRDALEEELGDLLFSAVNLARFLKVDPAVALHAANERFSRRFRCVEKGMAESGLALSAENMGKMDEFWNAAKAEEKAKP
jgi:tetrapyrrole methylase family protein/MazG family protein